MNITELDAYRLGDAVKFNDKLNPKLWGSDEHLLPEIREQLLRIAEDFAEFLGVSNFEIKDITISGSNAAYTYTANSDIDLHLVADLPKADASEVYRELFDAKKYQYNDQHNITIGGYDVELYVQNANQPHISQGIYSVLNNDWVSVPRRVKPTVDDISTRSKYETVSQQIEQAIESKDYETITALSNKIKKMRQAGLEQHGEFGPENLAFKMLRNQGAIERLYAARNAAKDQLLSLDERKKKKKSSRKKSWGYFGGYWYPGTGYAGQDTPAAQAADGGGDGGGESIRESVESSDEDILKAFVDFCVKELKIQHMPAIKLRRDPEWPKRHRTFGRYSNDDQRLEVAWGNRHIMDVLRTVAHELTHKRQHERESVPPSAGETGSEYENEANARAGVLMRDWAQLHPEHFEAGQADDLEEGWRERAGAVAAAACIAGTAGCSSTGQVLKTTQDVGRTVQTAKNMTRAGVQDELSQELRNFIRAQGGDPGSQNLSTLYKLKKRLTNQPDATNESASGYIPTKKQARDPRYSMALTVDIKPGQVGKEANKLKLKTDRQGQPQVARANGLVEALALEFAQFKKAKEDYSPDAPPGPEFKPTMPAGTLKVDVSDVYDWYKLGQHISNMKGLDKHDFGSGPPASIISFGDEDTEHKFIQDLKRTGLDVTDIDPADPVKRPGKTIKTDPTYNVDESKARYEMTDLDPWTFDQTPSGWRGLPNSARQADAIRQYIETYVKNGQFVGAPEGAKTLRPYILYWHLGQVLLQMGRNNMAVGVMRQALDDGEAGWNAYVMATISFLRKDRRDFDHWAPLARGNEETIKRLTAGWGLPYKQAYAGQTLNEDQQLDEVAMSPSALQKWANSDAAKGIRAGFEAELIFRDTTNDDDDDGEIEPDYDYDERARSVSQVIDFFNGGDYGGLGDRQEGRLQDGLDQQYMEWQDERMRDAFRDEQEDLIKKVLVDENDWEEDNEIQKQLELLDLSDDEMNAIIQAGERAPRFTKSSEQQAYIQANPLYKQYLDAQTEAEGLLDELVQDSIRAEDKFYDAALDDFRENFYVDDDSSFFQDVGLSYMSDIASEYNLDWPYMTGSGGGNNGGSRDWEDIGTSLQDAVDMPVKVSGNYHSTKRKEGQWIVEPDSSLDPDDREDFGLEIVSPPLPLLDALEKLQEVTDWANNPSEGNAYTNQSTGLHMGVSVPYKGGDVDYLKLILFLGDEYVLQSFGREANTYTKSAMSKFRENIKGGRADPTGALMLMKSNLIEFAYREIQKGVGTGKYTSAHIQDGYIEFRSAGGDWLAEESADPQKLSSTMLRYARAMQIAADPSAERQEFAKKLYKFVAPEGDSQLALFSQFAAGAIDKDQLKKQWAEKTIGTERKMNQRWKVYDRATGEPVPGQEYNGYTEEEARARAKGKLRPSASDRDFDAAYELRNIGQEQQWEIYSVDTGETLEIVKGRNKGEAADAVFDKYAAQKIGFNVRPYTDPATMTPRAKLAKRIASQPGKTLDYNYEIVNQADVRLPVVDKFYATNDTDAQKVYSQWLKNKDLPDDTADYGYRKVATKPAEEPPWVAQNFAPAQAVDATGELVWEIYDRQSGRAIEEILAADQADAESEAQAWLESISAQQPELFGVRPKMETQ